MPPILPIMLLIVSIGDDPSEHSNNIANGIPTIKLIASFKVRNISSLLCFIILNYFNLSTTLC